MPRFRTGHSVPLAERFWPRVDVGAVTGCWLWQGNIDTKGYGRFGHEGRSCYAHRVAYELLVGDIPEGLVLDHLCRVTACVNPAHLEPVTRVENIMRGEGYCATNARKSHCPQGHPLEGDNLMSGLDYRRCRTCRNIYRRGLRARRAAAGLPRD